MFRKAIIPVLIITALVAGIAFAMPAGQLPFPVGKPQTPIQNLKAPASSAAKSRCDTVTGTSAIQKRYSTAGKSGFFGTAFHPTTGAPIVVKWQEDGKHVWTGSTYELTNSEGTEVTYVTPSAFDNRTGAFCIRRQ